MNSSFKKHSIKEISFQATDNEQNKAIISLTNVFYKDILEGISLAVKEDEILTIIGPNGSGKTTLLKLIAGIYKPSLGDIFYKESITIGYMPQEVKFAQTLPLKVKDFLNLRKAIDRDFLKEKIKRINIEDILEKQVNSLSGGELQKVLFISAISVKPDLLILDEPINNLDINAQSSFYKILEEEQQAYKYSVVMSSHDIHVVMKRTDKVVCINKKICCYGHPETVRADKIFIDMFGKSLSVYKHEHFEEKGSLP